MGIDLGTSFTSASVADSSGIRMAPLSQGIVVPSIATPTPDGHLLTGLAAYKAADDPALLARGFKRRLGDPSPLILGGAAFSPAALMAAQLRDVLAQVARAMGAPPGKIVLTYPAIWGPYRREQFTEVPRLAGVSEYQLITEPEAAATHYSSERRLGDGEVVAVYDLGGGTFDTTILRMRSGGMEILGTPEGIEHMGGVDFDDALLAGLDERLDGAIGALDPDDPVAATALSAIRGLAVKAKEDLSVETEVTLRVPLPSGTRDVVISRLEFNKMITPSVRQTTEALRRTIASAGLRPEDLSAVLLAGGSSRIPLVAQMVSQEFGKPVRVTLHPKYTVALGAATVATRKPTPTPASTAVAVSGANDKADALVPTTGSPSGGSGRGGRTLRKRWLATGSAALVVIAGAVATTLLSPTETEVPSIAVAGDTSTSSNSSSARPTPAQAVVRSPMPVFHLNDVPPWAAQVSSEATGWRGSGFGPAGAQSGSVTATFDGFGGLKVTWDGTGPGQFYFQSPPDGAGPQDLSRLADKDSAVVFDVTVHKRPVGAVSAEVHCGHPCRSATEVASMFKRLPVGQKKTVAIPLRCFTDQGAGWDPTKVDIPFLIRTQRQFSASFADVRWTAGAAKGPAAVPCGKLAQP